MIKAVILAGGNGLRLQPLTNNRPKPLLQVIGKTILEHNLDQLEGLVDEVVVVVGFKKEMIFSLIGESYKGIKINYAVQENQIGTGDAVLQAFPFLDEKFIVLNGDDFYFREDIERCLKKHPSVLLSHSENPSSFGVVECQNGFVKKITEKPEKTSPNPLVNTGLYFLSKSFFDFEINKSERGEYELTDYIEKIALTQNLYFEIAKKWIPISYPWNLFDAVNFFLNKRKDSIEGVVEEGCFFSGKVTIESGALIKSGTRIEGPAFVGSGSIVGPNAFLRENSVIGRNCRIGNGVEIKNSIISEKTFVPHLSYVGDSILGENCNVGGGTIFANFRFDGKNIHSIVKENKIDTGRKKFGSVVGDNTKIGINCSFSPGILIGSDSTIGPHSFVRKNVENETIFFSQFKEEYKKQKDA